MFEVGKKYKTETGQNVYLCLFVSKQTIVFENVQTKSEWTTYLPIIYMEEVPPEPKRWSTWQNVYPERCGINVLPSKEWIALFAPMQLLTRLAMIRRDWEQHDGKDAVCVKVELEQV